MMMYIANFEAARRCEMNLSLLLYAGAIIWSGLFTCADSSTDIKLF